MVSLGIHHSVLVATNSKVFYVVMLANAAMVTPKYQNISDIPHTSNFRLMIHEEKV